ncbi:uncharacterized protein LOC122014003 [Zingiber officinale]|uniref:uncharacterized protein LOC122014003 n=1 Tax=Zingiber officinale TaxID=94328 RepID=UPI001C4D429A|nr:uncharacterized protein LOC122014003 [Zingiber officinale]
MDIMGHFPMATSEWKCLLVAVNYFSKWLEAKPLAKITEHMVMKFVWKNIICRFGIPRWIVSDNGRQFAGQRLREWCEGYGIQQAFTSMAYLQSNGQAKVTNREILQVLRARLDHMGELVVKDRSRMLQFVQGLDGYLQVKIAGFGNSSYIEALDIAFMIKSAQQRTIANKKRKQNDRTSG